MALPRSSAARSKVFCVHGAIPERFDQPDYSTGRSALVEGFHGRQPCYAPGRKHEGGPDVPDRDAAPGAERARARPGGENPRPELREVPAAAGERGAAVAGLLVGRGAGLFRRRAVPALERHPQQPHHALGRGDRRDQRLSQALELRQRQHPRPPGPPRHRRARPARHPHRIRRPHHRADGPLRRQAAQFAERHRGEVRRLDLVHRHECRHHRQLERRGRRAGIAAAGLSHRRQDRPGRRS